MKLVWREVDEKGVKTAAFSSERVTKKYEIRRVGGRLRV